MCVCVCVCVCVGPFYVSTAVITKQENMTLFGQCHALWFHCLTRRLHCFLVVKIGERTDDRSGDKPYGSSSDGLEYSSDNRPDE